MKDFIPVLMGNDINVYSMARAFYEEYGKKSYIFCKMLSGPCQDSDLVNIFVNKDIDRNETFLSKINEFARKNLEKNILLIGCGDNYVKVISSNLNNLEKNVVAPYMDYAELEPLTNKENFYKLCEKHGIDYPKTKIIHFETENFNYSRIDIELKPPFIVKPADSVEYWKYPFKNQDKVFILNSKDEVYNIIEKIFNAGYREGIVIQEYIPGDDTNMRVLTCYSDKNGIVKLMALGHVLLEEHTPKGIGNHAVILNSYDEEICLKYKSFLEKMNYKGFSNFDIKFDIRDGSYRAFELNPRQGRSNFYVTNSGYNLAKMIVEDYILKKDNNNFDIVSNDRLWMVVPKSVAFKYVKDINLIQKMRRLIKEKKYVNPLLYKKDKNIKRRIRIFKNIISHHFKFKKYYGEK